MLFVLLGAILAFGGTALALGGAEDEETSPVVWGVMALAGVAGVVGGIATFRGNAKWAPLAYVMAALYLFMFPIGTILSYIMLTRLSGYLRSVKRLREAASAKRARSA